MARPAFDAAEGAGEVARLICRAQWVEVQAREAQVVQGADAEAVHKLRVATQRLRAVLWACMSVLGRKDTRRVRRELAWLRGLLGVVRDHDLLIRDLERTRRGTASRASFAAARRAVLQSRERARLSMLRGFRSRRRARLTPAVERLLAPAVVPDAAHVPSVAGVLVERAVRAAERRVQRARKACHGRANAAQAHRLRRAIKRLRYVGEALLPGRSEAVAEAIAALVEAQDRLGRLQDDVVIATLASASARDARRRRGPRATGAQLLDDLASAARSRANEAERVVKGAWDALQEHRASKGLLAAGQRWAHGAEEPARARSATSAAGKEEAMRLYLVRHASAAPLEAAGGDDAQRPLTDKGRNQCLLVGRWLRQLGVRPDLVVSSPARRALETARAIAREMRVSIEVTPEPALAASAAPEARHRAANAWRGDVVIAVGHEPSLSQLASAIVSEGAASLELRKAGIVEIEVQRRDPLRGTLLGLLRPGHLAADAS